MKSVFVGKEKGESQKGVSRKQSTPNFPKTNICTYVCVSGGKKCLFFGKFEVLCFLETPALRFALLRYYRRSYLKRLEKTWKGIRTVFFKTLSYYIYFRTSEFGRRITCKWCRNKLLLGIENFSEYRGSRKITSHEKLYTIHTFIFVYFKYLVMLGEIL